LLSAHQNNIKTSKKNFFEAKKKINFLKVFLKHKNKRAYQNETKKE